MANLENLTAKILADSKEKARQAIEAAEQEARRIVDEEAAAAEKEKARILEEAKVEAERTREQIVLAKKLAIRDDILGAKQEMLDTIFSEALDTLNSMDEAKFLQFLTRQLSALDTDDQEIILPKKFASVSLDSLNTELKKSGKKGNLTLYQGEREVKDGFILLKGGIEQNSTFEALIDYYRYELEGDVLRALYE